MNYGGECRWRANESCAGNETRAGYSLIGVLASIARRRFTGGLRLT